MFMGEYNHSIDAKGRLIVPAKLRDGLGEHFVVTKGLDKCLWVFPEEEWQKFSENLATLPVSKKDARNLVRSFLAGACEVETDKMGRILVPQVLRDYAGLETDAVLVGVGKRVEIWNKAAWDETSAFDDMDELAEQLGDLGFEI